MIVCDADGIASLLNVVTHRPRPFASIPSVSVLITHPSSGSFSSVHATTAFAGAALLSWLWLPGRIACAAVAILIASSRVYFGVHYPSDAIGGAAIDAGFAATVQRTRFRDRFARPCRVGAA